jgi:hypothetical protein
MVSKRNLLAVVFEFSGILLAIVGGIALPILDRRLGPNLRGFQYLIYGATAAFDRTGVLRMLIVFSVLFSRLSSSPLFSGLFPLFGVGHVLLLCHLMWALIRGLEPDQDIISLMGLAEGHLYLYFGPTIATLVIKALWSIRYYLIIGIPSLFAALAACPNPLLHRIIDKTFQITLWSTKFTSRYDLAIHDIFVRTYEALSTLFDRWEVEIAKRHRDGRLSPLDTYDYCKIEKPDCIRLLELKRRTFFSEPSCKLIEVSLRNAPPFEAVSYTWGDKPPHVPLKVDGRQLKVTSTVEELLFYRRSILGPRLFWIDAICINQSDKDEKNKQLPLMTEIYSRASRVIVWLGAPESRSDTLAIRKMIRVLSFPQNLNIISTTVLLSSVFEREEEGYIAIAKLLQHPWFERIWVVQEVAVGKRVHVMYHGTCIDWEVLACAAKRLGHDGELRRGLHYHTSPNIAKLYDLDPISRKSLDVPQVEQLRWTQLVFLTHARVSKGTRIGIPLSCMLGLGMSFKSTNPRDKIFAVLGIAEDGHKLPFKPDYYEDVDKIFLKTAAFVLSTEDWFSLFSMTGRGYQSFSSSSVSQFGDELPSWVPDFSSDSLAGFRPAFSVSMASADPKGKITFTSDEKIIKIQAVEFDEICIVGPICDIRKHPNHVEIPAASMERLNTTAKSTQLEEFTTKNAKDWYFDCKRLIHESLASTSKSRRALDQEFWALCMCQNEYEGLGPEPTHLPVISPEAQSLFEHFLLEPPEEALKNGGTGMGFDVEFHMMMYLERRFCLSASLKAFCITAAGKMALVPPLAREKEIIVHVRGGYMPIVLRKIVLGERRAELVGSCIVLGVQDVYFGSKWEDWLLV